jgi:non-homologous end joining protein Ku
VGIFRKSTRPTSRPHYAAPDRSGERAYSLLYTFLRESRYVALADRGDARPGAHRGYQPAGKGLLAHTMFYQDEIRAGNEFEVRASDVEHRKSSNSRKPLWERSPASLHRKSSKMPIGRNCRD